MFRQLASICLLALTLLDGGCTPAASGALPGVVEAELVRVAAAAGGRLVELNAVRGGSVAAGAPLFRIEAPEFSAKSRDEIGVLAESFARMRKSLVHAMKLLDS